MNLKNVREALDRWLVQYDSQEACVGTLGERFAHRTDEVVAVDEIQWWFYFDRIEGLKAVDGWGRQVVITSAAHLNYVAMLLAVRQADTVLDQLVDEYREDEWRDTQ